MPGLGRLIPKDWKHIDKYPFRRLGIETAVEVEKIIIRPPLRSIYDQGYTNGCTGYAASWMSSIVNSQPIRDWAFKVYNPLWLYHQGMAVDGDPSTTPEADIGGYVWSVMEVLRTVGHVLKKRNGMDYPPKPEEGIKSYYWCRTVDEMRTAISLGRPVVFGINWYEEFFDPVRIDCKYWIGTHTNWGRPVGGHCICSHGARDSLQAFFLVNTWGDDEPPVWISYDNVERLMREQGEACVAIDLPKS